MGRAVKESGGDPRRLVEIDIERDEEGGDQRQHVEERRSLCSLNSSGIGWQDLGGHYIPELQVKKCSSTLPSSRYWSETCEELGTTLGKE